MISSDIEILRYKLGILITDRPETHPNFNKKVTNLFIVKTITSSAITTINGKSSWKRKKDAYNAAVRYVEELMTFDQHSQNKSLPANCKNISYEELEEITNALIAEGLIEVVQVV